MDTATAAQQAGVTVATVRHWCRIGAVAAVKRAGRWVIDAASLAYRISLGVRRTTRKIVYTVENMIAIGGSEWERHGKHRVYLNNWADLLGLEGGRYKSGNIRWATLGGKDISNSEAGRILCQVRAVYYDVTDGRLHVQWNSWAAKFPRSFRDREDLAQAIFKGIRAAIAAL